MTYYVSKSLVELGWVAKGLPSALRGTARAMRAGESGLNINGHTLYAQNKLMANLAGKRAAETGAIKKPFNEDGLRRGAGSVHRIPDSQRFASPAGRATLIGDNSARGKQANDWLNYGHDVGRSRRFLLSR